MSQFARAKYLNLETSKRDGTPVRTPVWFAHEHNERDEPGAGPMYLYTLAEAGKVKRIRREPRVRIAPCNITGKLRGEWIPARATIVTDPAEIRRGHELLDRKYFRKRLFNLYRRLRPAPIAIIAVQPE
jgi:PPOX class probable F420-dependent enzyme